MQAELISPQAGAGSGEAVRELTEKMERRFTR